MSFLCVIWPIYFLHLLQQHSSEQFSRKDWMFRKCEYINVSSVFSQSNVIIGNINVALQRCTMKMLVMILKATFILDLEVELNLFYVGVYNYIYNCILSIFTTLIPFIQSIWKLRTKPIEEEFAWGAKEACKEENYQWHKWKCWQSLLRAKPKPVKTVWRINLLSKSSKKTTFIKDKGLGVQVGLTEFLWPRSKLKIMI